MFDKLLTKLSSVHQGYLALLMGLILVLGSLGKLGVLQGILNTILIAVGLILVFWGFNKSNSMQSLQKLIKKK